LGDICRIDSVWYVFYRWNGVLTKNKIFQAQKNCESVEKLTVRDNEDFYVLERKRLIDFIGGLLDTPRKKRPVVPARPAASGGPAVPLPAESAAKAEKITAEKTAVPAVKTGTEKTALSRTPDALNPAASPAGSSKTARSTLTKGRAGKVLLPAMLAAALGGGVFLLVRNCSGGTPVQDETELRQEAPREPASDAPAEENPAESGQAAPSSPDPAASSESPRGPASAAPVESSPAGSSPAGQPSPDTAFSPASPREPASAAPVERSPAGSSPAGRSPSDTAVSPASPRGPAAAAPAERSPAQSLEIDPFSIRISVLDIYYCVNEIAVKNGYHTLVERGTQKPDPNRIYPGRVLVLPNAAQYVIDLHDTLWGISTQYIRENIRELCEAYDTLMRPYRRTKVPADKKEDVAGEIRVFIGRCKSENLRRLFEERIRNL
jgi:hypothetical protein